MRGNQESSSHPKPNTATTAETLQNFSNVLNYNSWPEKTKTKTQQTLDSCLAAFHILKSSQKSLFWRASYQMKPKSIRRHAYLDRNSQRWCGRVRPDLFAGGEAKCLSMLPVHLQQFAARRARSPPICSAANKHFMCHRGPRRSVSLRLPFASFCCRRARVRGGTLGVESDSLANNF